MYTDFAHQLAAITESRLSFVSLERLELSPSAPEAGTLSIALQGLDDYFTMFMKWGYYLGIFMEDGKVNSPLSDLEITFTRITALNGNSL